MLGTQSTTARIKLVLGACGVLVVLVLAASSCPAADADAKVSLVLETNKKSYLVGEPVLMRTTLHNEADEPYAVGRFCGMTFGGPYAHLGFSVEVRRGEEALGSIFGPRHEAPLGAAPRHHEGICDRGIFPSEIGARQTVYRVDVCCFEEPGTYQLSAFLAGEEGRRVDSETIEIKVVPLDQSDDPISELVDADRVVALGRSIVVVYYLDGEVINYGGAMKPEELAPIIRTVLARGGSSAFYEHLRYISLLYERDEQRSMRSQLVLDSVEAIERAESFLRDYPDSWLAPDVMRLLFFTHLANKEPAKALEIGKRALALDPVPAVVPGTLIPERVDELSRTAVDQVANTVPEGGD